jgi:hypothetical protein
MSISTFELPSDMLVGIVIAKSASVGSRVDVTRKYTSSRKLMSIIGDISSTGSGSEGTGLLAMA